MSFALTTAQILSREKTVTRRLGWRHLKAGDLIRAVKKCQGLKKGEKVEPLAVLRVVNVRREVLGTLLNDLTYGVPEVRREGFGDHPDLRWPSQFVQFFCDSHRVTKPIPQSGVGHTTSRPCEPRDEITRIEFEYVEAAEVAA